MKQKNARPILAIVLGLNASNAMAQEATTSSSTAVPGSSAISPDIEKSDWTFSVAPYLWGARLDGKARVGRVESDVDVSFGDILKDLNIAAMVAAEARYKRFGIFVNPFFVRTKSESHGAIDTKVTNDSLIVAGGVSYRIADFEVGELAEGQPIKIGIEPYAGVRYTNLRLEIELKKGSAPIARNLPQTDKRQDWLDPIFGSRFIVNLTDRWVLATAADVGGFGVGTDLSWNALGTIGYRDSVFGVPTTYTAGYRALYQNYDSNSFKWDVTQQGPLLGAVFKF